MTSDGHEVDIHVESERSTLIDFIIEHKLKNKKRGRPGNEAAISIALLLSMATLHVYCSLVPRLSWNVDMYRRENQVSFVCKYDVTEIGLKQNGNVLCVVHPSVCVIFDL